MDGQRQYGPENIGERNAGLEADNKLLLERIKTLESEAEKSSLQLTIAQLENKLLRESQRADKMEAQLKSSAPPAKRARHDNEENRENENDLLRGMQKRLEELVANNAQNLKEKMEKVEAQFAEQAKKTAVAMAEQKRTSEAKFREQFETTNEKVVGLETMVAKMTEQIGKLKESAQSKGQMENQSSFVDGAKNRWDSTTIGKWMTVNADALTCSPTGDCVRAWSTVRAEMPFNGNFLHEPPTYFYYEITIKRMNPMPCSLVIGLSAASSFPLFEDFVGDCQRSFAVNDEGDYWGNGKVQEFGEGFGEGDVIGCGLKEGNRLFFTKNGIIYGETISLSSDDTSEALYPTVTAFGGAEFVANFGATSFKFNLWA